MIRKVNVLSNDHISCFCFPCDICCFEVGTKFNNRNACVVMVMISAPDYLIIVCVRKITNQQSQKQGHLHTQHSGLIALKKPVVTMTLTDSARPSCLLTNAVAGTSRPAHSSYSAHCKLRVPRPSTLVVRHIQPPRALAQKINQEFHIV